MVGICRIKTGARTSAPGKPCCRIAAAVSDGTLSNGKITAVREAYRNGEGGYATLAKKFGISSRTVRNHVLASQADLILRSCGRKIRHDTAAAASLALAQMIAERRTERERSCLVYACQHRGSISDALPPRLQIRLVTALTGWNRGTRNP